MPELRRRWFHRRTFTTLEAIKEANAETRQSFFGSRRDEAWDRTILGGVYKGRIFISSEKPGSGWFPSGLEPEVRFSIHVICEDGIIDTIGWLGYKTKFEAERAIEAMFGGQESLL